MNIRGKVLRDADHCINGEREGQYGSPEDNFRKIAILWSDYLNLTNKVQLSLSAADVAKMMVLFKLARSMGPQDKYDNYVDLIGYAACAAEAKSIEDPSLIGFECIQHKEGIIVEQNPSIIGFGKECELGDVGLTFTKADVDKKYYNCHLCANSDTASTEDPCMGCKPGVPNGSNFVPKNIERPKDNCALENNADVEKVFKYDRACPYCKYYGTDISDDPCYTCKEHPGFKPTNYEPKPVPKNTINRVCTTCVNQFMDRDVEPCLSCDPKTKSNWKYEED